MSTERVLDTVYLQGWTISSVNTRDVVIIENELIVLTSNELRVFDTKKGTLLYTTPLAQDYIKLAYADNKLWLLKNASKNLVAIHRYTGFIYEETTLSIPVDFSISSCITSNRDRVLYFIVGNTLYSYSLLTRVLTNIAQVPVNTQRSLAYSRLNSELLVQVSDEDKIFILSLLGAGRGVINRQILGSSLEYAPIDCVDNTLFLAQQDTSKMLVVDIESRLQLIHVELTDTAIPINKTNNVLVRTIVGDQIGRSQVNALPVTYFPIKPLDLLTYLLSNPNNLITNITNTSTNTLLQRLDHYHVNLEDLETIDNPVDGVNLNFVILFQPLDSSIDLYKQGYLLMKGNTHDYTNVNQSITLAEAPEVDSLVLASYLYTTPFSFGHVHQTEIPSGVVDGVNTVFVLSEIPALGSLEFWRQGFLVKEGTDFTRAGSTLTFIEPPTLDTKLQADYYLLDEEDLDSRHIHVTNTFHFTSTINTFFLTDIPLVSSARVFLQGQRLLVGVDYLVSEPEKRIQMLYNLPPDSRVIVTYEISSTSLDTLLVPVDELINTFLTIEPGQQWIIHLGDQVNLEGIEIVATSEAQSTLELISSTDNDYYQVESLIDTDSVVNKTRVSSYQSSKTSDLLTNYIGVRNRSLVDIRLHRFHLYVEGDIVDSEIDVLNGFIDSQGIARAEYSVSRHTVNFVLNPNFAGIRAWQLNGSAQISSLVNFAHTSSDTSLRLTGVGINSEFSRAYQLIHLNQNKARAITLSAFVTGNVSTSISGSCSLVITPVVLQTQIVLGSPVTSEVMLAPIILIDIPKGAYNNKRFSNIYVPELPLLRVLVELRTERLTIGDLHWSGVQLEEGLLSEFTEFYITQANVKSAIEF